MKRKPTGETALFEQIRKKRPFISEVSGRDLSCFINNTRYFNCFAHIIPKNGIIRLVFTDKSSKDRILRLNAENIMLLHPDEHFIVDNGTEKQRNAYELKYPDADFSIYYDKKEYLIEWIRENESTFLY